MNNVNLKCFLIVWIVLVLTGACYTQEVTNAIGPLRFSGVNNPTSTQVIDMYFKGNLKIQVVTNAAFVDIVNQLFNNKTNLITHKEMEQGDAIAEVVSKLGQPSLISSDRNMFYLYRVSTNELGLLEIFVYSTGTRYSLRDHLHDARGGYHIRSFDDQIWGL